MGDEDLKALIVQNLEDDGITNVMDIIDALGETNGD